MTVANLANWAPSQLRDYYKRHRESLSPLELRVLEALGSNPRARVFWESAGREAIGSECESALEWKVYYAALRGLNLPGKPGDLPPKAREEYLSDVRKTAQKLKTLLLETRFDQRIAKKTREEAKTIDDLASKFVDYPFGALTLLLEEVVTWTNLDDRYDVGGNSAWMLRQQGASADKLYLLFHLDGVLKHEGFLTSAVAMAELMSALLGMPQDSPVSGKDVESLRKRLSERAAERRKLKRDRPKRLFVDGITQFHVPQDE